MPTSAFAEPIVLTVLALLLAGAAACDLRRFRIPNALSLAVAGLFLLGLPVVGPSPFMLGASILTGLVVFAAGAGLFACGALGGGDVKLLSALSLWAGPAGILPLLTMTALAGGGLALAWLLAGAVTSRSASTPHGEAPVPVLRRPVPYAVAIAAGGADLILRRLAA
ncbi:A24 family peptidase [Marinivivus vitaminiproducens]|uniref:A24 family peptidase n=1 Tax=Marinivivus vitaminiproducens TaxID=3035935 RepID=UPI0027A10B2B|nr:prepilin peptidase [Geminicoccaceae bacterium SCSIO 64248]